MNKMDIALLINTFLAGANVSIVMVGKPDVINWIGAIGATVVSILVVVLKISGVIE